jgi:hypothetical protein
VSYQLDGIDPFCVYSLVNQLTAIGSREEMNSQICKCCGKPVAEQGDAPLRNPNVCESCSSVEDTITDPGPSEAPGSPPTQEATGGEADAIAFAI